MANLARVKGTPCILHMKMAEYTHQDILTEHVGQLIIKKANVFGKPI